MLRIASCKDNVVQSRGEAIITVACNHVIIFCVEGIVTWMCSKSRRTWLTMQAVCWGPHGRLNALELADRWMHSPLLVPLSNERHWWQINCTLLLLFSTLLRLVPSIMAWDNSLDCLIFLVNRDSSSWKMSNALENVSWGNRPCPVAWDERTKSVSSTTSNVTKRLNTMVEITRSYRSHGNHSRLRRRDWTLETIERFFSAAKTTWRSVQHNQTPSDEDKNNKPINGRLTVLVRMTSFSWPVDVEAHELQQ